MPWVQVLLESGREHGTLRAVERPEGMEWRRRHARCATTFGLARGVDPTPLGCAVLPAALRLLSAASGVFDMIGLVGCLASVLRGVERALGLPHGNQSVRRIRPAGAPAHHSVLWNSTHEWSWEVANASLRAWLLELTACDRSLFDLAARRAQTELPGGCMVP